MAFKVVEGKPHSSWWHEINNVEMMLKSQCNSASASDDFEWIYVLTLTDSNVLCEKLANIKLTKYISLL